MVERHYDEDALVTMLDTRAIHSDPHLAACGECSERLHDFRLVTSALRDAATWDQREVDTRPNPNTIATLRAFADTMAAEDTAAEAYLADLLAGPRETWMAKLDAHPEYRTAGVVRGLIAALDAAYHRMPADAVILASLATNIVDHLDSAKYSSNQLAQSKAVAWREHAYALYYVGRFAEVLPSVDRAIAEASRCVVDEYETARINIVRILALKALEKTDDALAIADLAAATFRRFGDDRRLASARLAEAHLLFDRGRYNEAEIKLDPVATALSASGDLETYARVLANLGYACWQAGRLEDAIRQYQHASAILLELNIDTERIRIDWNVAAILASVGRPADALERLHLVRREFTRLGMASEAALAGLDIAELLLADGRFAAVAEICREAMRSFTESGVSYTPRALTALAYIREAATLQTAAPVHVRHVRDFIRRLPEDANLLFAAPPD